MAGAALRRLKAAIFKPMEPAHSTLDLREEFGVLKSVEHGFPHRPSAMAYSPDLGLLAVGCQSGELALYGKAGVETSAKHEPESSVVQIIFLGRQLRVLSVGFENDLHLWSLENCDDRCRMVQEASYQVVYPGIKRVSVACYPRGGEHIAVGTEGGNVLLVSSNKLMFSNKQEDIIYWNKATEPAQGTNKLHPGSVEALDSCPTDPDKLLIGFEKGMLCLWSLSEKMPLRNFPPIQYLCSAIWHPAGHMFASCHEDGTIAMWSVDMEEDHGGSVKPYGLKEECRKVQQLAWRGHKDDGMLIFEGGLGRQEYGDKFCVSVQVGKDLTGLEFTSRVIQFSLVDDDEGNPDTLIVLCEEELVAIDLKTPGLPSIPKPYLYSLHDSPLTCIQHVADCPPDFIQALHNANYEPPEKSTRPWPIRGGVLCGEQDATKNHNLLLTGHEDGSIRFWDATGVSMSLIYKVTTNSFFINVDIPPEEDDMEEAEADKWPVFVKAGTFDPFCDDPRLAVMQIEVCPLSRTMAIAGYGGQVFVFDFAAEASLSQFNQQIVEMKLDGEDISRKLNEMLEFQTGSLEVAAGFQPSVGLLICPPAPIIALSLSSQYGLVGFGCRRGLSVIDYFQSRVLATECTILEEESRHTLSRLQSIRKSFRLTVRRIRNQSVRVLNGRRQRHNYDTPMAQGSASAVSAAPPTRPKEKRETEEEIQQRRDQLGNGVRCLMFSNTFAPGSSTLSPAAFGCTNSGRTFLYSMELPAEVNRYKETVALRPIEREFALRHGAPIIAFGVVDHSGRHIASSFEISMNRAKSADNRVPHYAVFCTEEQIKVVTLPGLKNFSKYKLYDSDGSQVQRAGFVQTEDGAQMIGIISNEGDALLLSLPELTVRMRSPAVRWDDFRGQRTFVLTRRFEAFHMRSPSQLQRLALAPRHKVVANCNVELLAERSTTQSAEASASATPSSDTGIEKRTLSNTLSSAFGSLFHNRTRTPSPSGTADQQATASDTKRKGPPVPAPPASRSKAKSVSSPAAKADAPANETDFFADEAARAEEEGDFVSEVLSGMDSFHTPPESVSSPSHDDKPTPKPRATSTPRAGPPQTANERMIQAASERGDRLTATDVRTKKMSDSAAGLAAISGLLASKGDDTEATAGNSNATEGAGPHKDGLRTRQESIPNDPKGHEDLEMILDLPTTRTREVNIDEAANRHDKPAGTDPSPLAKPRPHPRKSSSSSSTAAAQPRTRVQGSKKWWRLK
ncbi:LLGL scribble cell polarity complex component 2-like isoform X1 [Sycon ciliatum]|uniref:LLGL scribble cell polarity complex component 2-like isoform X1 n=1 Tax=Sycon ciliatum TaxID=27933 RepID=UPI0031F694F1